MVVGGDRQPNHVKTGACLSKKGVFWKGCGVSFKSLTLLGFSSGNRYGDRVQFYNLKRDLQVRLINFIDSKNA